MQCDDERLRDRAHGGVGGWLDEEEEDWRAEVGESYYLDMLRDDARNKAYRDGLERELRRVNGTRGSSSVLDIGTGSGLLAMMAKRAGLCCMSAKYPGTYADTGEPVHILCMHASPKAN
jgi:predicted RNA methylase